MIERILEVKNLKKYYGKKDFKVKALDGISFQVMIHLHKDKKNF